MSTRENIRLIARSPLDLAARLGDDRWQLEGASNCRSYPQGHDSSCSSYITVDHWRLLS